MKSLHLILYFANLGNFVNDQIKYDKPRMLEIP